MTLTAVPTPSTMQLPPHCLQNSSASTYLPRNPEPRNLSSTTAGPSHSQCLGLLLKPALQKMPVSRSLAFRHTPSLKSRGLWARTYLYSQFQFSSQSVLSVWAEPSTPSATSTSPSNLWKAEFIFLFLTATAVSITAFTETCGILAKYVRHMISQSLPAVGMKLKRDRSLMPTGKWAGYFKNPFIYLICVSVILASVCLKHLQTGSTVESRHTFWCLENKYNDKRGLTMECLALHLTKVGLTAECNLKPHNGTFINFLSDI